MIPGSLPGRINFVFTKYITRFIDKIFLEIPLTRNQDVYKNFLDCLNRRIKKMPSAAFPELVMYLIQEIFYMKRSIEDRRFEEFLMQNNMMAYTYGISRNSSSYASVLGEVVTEDLMNRLMGSVIASTIELEKVVMVLNRIVNAYVRSDGDDFRRQTMSSLGRLSIEEKSAVLMTLLIVYADYQMETIAYDESGQIEPVMDEEDTEALF